MGSSGSKGKGLSCASSSNSSPRKSRRGLSKVHRVFQSSCLPTLSGSFESHDGDRGKENEGDASFSETQTERGLMKFDGYGKLKLERSAESPYLSADVELDEWDPGSLTHATARAGSHSAQASSAQSLNPSSRFLSRFSRIPGSLSFRLTRATSLGSSSPYPVSSTSLPILDNEDELHLQPGRVRGLISRDETGGHCGMLLSSQLDETPMQCHGDGTADFRLNMREFGISDCTPYDETITSPHDQATNADFAEARALDLATCVDNPERTSTNIYSPITNNGSENAESRLSDRHCGNREPIERNSRFSRTLSVGRLRDRVLRRSSLPGSTLYPFQQEREERDGSHISDREARNVERRASTLESSELTTSTTLGYCPPDLSSELTTSTTLGYCPPDLSSSFFSIQDYGVQTTRPRESRYHDLLEHRSNFLERRRRIRSQVRALQRLGSRFENLPEHERSCVLSGQHRSGRCTCHTNNRNSNLNANLNDNTTARASISRIVLLAEALFEVLDEIHQQSVVLSSRPSVSVIGSIPAPNQVVDSLPIKLYSKLHKHQNEEVALCYICLVEYEEGDSMRILPCHHEFHKSCVDKWLKEIHRVCPLCRGDICRSDTTAEN